MRSLNYILTGLAALLMYYNTLAGEKKNTLWTDYFIDQINLEENLRLKIIISTDSNTNSSDIDSFYNLGVSRVLGDIADYISPENPLKEKCKFVHKRIKALNDARSYPDHHFMKDFYYNII